MCPLSRPASPPAGSFLAAAALVLACGPPRAAEPPAGSGEGTRRMAARLARLADELDRSDSVYTPERRVATLRSIAPPPDPRSRIRLQARLARALLHAGESEAAFTEATAARAVARAHPGLLDRGFLDELDELVALAALRFGEQRNCLAGHHRQSCLMPIEGGGVHRFQEGSRAAFAEHLAILERRPDDLGSRWLLNVAAMTLGEYPAGVPERWRIPPEAFASEHDVGRFPDLAPEAGVDLLGTAGGVAMEDFDGDGRLDLMVSAWGIRDPLRLLRNRGDGTFDEVTEQAGIAGLTGGLNLVHADPDNDGDADVLVLRGAWKGRLGRQPSSLLRNRGDGTFDDVTEEAGLLGFHPTQTAAWADVDGDGWLDLFLGAESTPGETHRCRLFRNRGVDAAGVLRFTDVAPEVGLDIVGFVKGVVWGDVDDDGRPDLYVSKLGEPNQLFRNETADARWSFRDVTAEAGVAEPLASFPTWFFDYDQDGRLDLFVSGYPPDFLHADARHVAADYLGLPTEAERPRLYRNESAGGRIRFADVTREAGLDVVVYTMGCNFGDLDGDGWPDAYLGTGAPDFRALMPNRMFRNDGGRRFQDVTTSGGFGHLQKGHAIAFGDLDEDGDQDVYAVMGGAYSGDVYPDALFVNPGHGSHWLTLRLEGTRSNRAAIGARLRLSLAGGREVHATVATGGSFGSQSLQQELGLGAADRVDRLEVRWPSGRVQTFADLGVDRILRLREGDPAPVEVPARPFALGGGSASHRHPPS